MIILLFINHYACDRVYKFTDVVTSTIGKSVYLSSLSSRRVAKDSKKENFLIDYLSSEDIINASFMHHGDVKKKQLMEQLLLKIKQNPSLYIKDSRHSLIF